MKNNKRNFMSRIIGVCLSGVIGFMSLGGLVAEAKSNNSNQVETNVSVSENTKETTQYYKIKTVEDYHKETEITVVTSSTETQVSASENEKKSEQYYRTKTGKCYHKEGCSHLKKSKIEVSNNEIEKAELKPCSKCCK